jgi:pantetheine-phosphate adenylyltransferase
MYAMFSGSFDPFHWGHYDIVSRAIDYFDAIYIVIVAENGKDSLIDLDTRKKIIESYFVNKRDIYVDIIHGTVPDYAYMNQISVNIRSVKNVDNISHELELFEYNNQNNSELDTFFLPVKKEFMSYSSSICKNILSQHGDISKYVNMFTKRTCELIVNNRVIVLVDSLAKDNTNQLCIDMSNEFNDIVHISVNDIISEIFISSEPYALVIKDKLRRLIDNTIVNGMEVDSERLYSIASEKQSHREIISELLKESIKHVLHSRLTNLDLDNNVNSIVLIENSILNSNNLLKYASNNLIYVTEPNGEVNYEHEYLINHSEEEGNASIIYTPIEYDINEIYRQIIYKML